MDKLQNLGNQLQELKANYFTSPKDGIFADSNNRVAQFAFVLLVLIGFMILYQIGVNLLNYYLTPTKSPYLVNGMLDGKKVSVVSQNPLDKKAVIVNKSKNENTGIEFTWSFWINLEDMDHRKGQLRHIFHKGEKNIKVSKTGACSKTQDTEEQSLDENYGMDGMNFPNNSPGVYLAPNENNIIIFFNTYKTLLEKIEIPEVPMQKWFNMMIRCQDKTIDVYINGVIASRHILSGVPKQNRGDIHIGLNGGFGGYLSNLRYFEYAVTTNDIDDILKDGTDRTFLNEKPSRNDETNYLSYSWYSSGSHGRI